MPTTPRSRRLRAAVLLVLIVAAGLATRALPGSMARDVAGDALYALAAYTGLVVLLPRRHPLLLTLVAGGWCVLIEIFQLTGLPARWEAVFPPATLVLGAGFDARDLAVYVVAVLSAGAVDLAARRRRLPGSRRKGHPGQSTPGTEGTRMTSSSVPAPIAAFIDATNAGDSAAFLSAFTEDAVLSDWGRVYRGREAIADWDRTDNIGKRSHFELVDVAPGAGAGTYVVTLTVSGDGYNGTGPMTITVADERISRLTIAPE